jgi:5'-nucleotidase (lipoprotein e(P4) family)
MQKNTIVIALVSVVLFNACTVSKPGRQQQAAQAGLVSYGPAWAALWQQRSAEYKALCFQAYNIAKEKLDLYLTQPGNQPFAVVTDVDETVLDNSPYTVHQSLKAELYSDSSWMEWTARAECDTVPGALSFLKYAAGRGVQVFYVTNRLEAERNATLANLQKWDFPNADTEHLLMKTKTSGKDERRASVASRFNILLFMGDNLGDFSGIFDHRSYQKRDSLAEANAGSFGRRFIVLPNAMYGEWQGALLEYNYRLPKEKQDSVLKKWLKNY